MTAPTVVIAAGEPAKKEKGEIEFPAPEGFQAPDNTEPGSSFEVMATVCLKEDGKLCLEAIDGAPVSSEEKEDDAEEETEPDPGFLGAVEKGMGA